MSTRRDFLKAATLLPIVTRGTAVRAQPRAEADYVIVGAGSAGCVLAYRLSADPVRAGHAARGRHVRRIGPRDHHAGPLGVAARLAVRLGLSHGGREPAWTNRQHRVPARQGARRVERDQRDDLRPRRSALLRPLARSRQHRLGLRRCPAAVHAAGEERDAAPASIAEPTDRWPSPAATTRTRPSRVSDRGHRTTGIRPTRASTSTGRSRRAWPATCRRTSSTGSATAPRPRSSCRRWERSNLDRALAGASRRSSRRRHARRRRGVPARRPARSGAGGTRGHALRRRHRIAEAADALGHRARRSRARARHRRRRRPAWRRRQPPGSSEAVGAVAGQDRAARVDRHRGAVHALQSHRGEHAAGRPAVLRGHAGSSSPIASLRSRASLVQPRSRGEVRLRSANPMDAPFLRANYLQEAADVQALVRGVHLARWFASVSVFDPAARRGAGARRRRAVRRGSRAFRAPDADTIYHSAGTCRMGPATEPMAVVDPSLRVRGVQGLRVADASIMPEVVNATTHAACVMIGEKAADLVRS